MKKIKSRKKVIVSIPFTLIPDLVGTHSTETLVYLQICLCVNLQILQNCNKASVTYCGCYVSGVFLISS